jgi:predicted transcriptional regulator of viral defense system
MNIRSYLKEIRKKGKRCFTVQDVVDEYGVSRGAVRVSVHNLLKAGDLISPARGLYVIVPPECQPYGSIPAKELVPLIAQYMKADYYVSLLSAGLFYGATHQKSAKFQVISNKRIKRNLIFGDVEISFIYKKFILDLPTKNFTVSTGYLKVATPELTILDLLSYPDHAGGLNHIATVLSELVDSLDADKLISLARETKTEYQLQRIGYILENIEFMDDQIATNLIEALAENIQQSDNHYIPLASEIPITSYPRDKKWKIVINTDIESDL